jgi:hypothetical protein
MCESGQTSMLAAVDELRRIFGSTIPMPGASGVACVKMIGASVVPA